MKHLFIMLTIPFLLAAPVSAAPLSVQNADPVRAGDMLSELESALGEQEDTDREDVFSKVERALAGEAGKYTENTGENTDKALAGRPQAAADPRSAIQAVARWSVHPQCGSAPAPSETQGR